jgi:hypothetical protein
MALLFVDGFDHYASADVGKKGWILAGTGSILPTGGRRGGGAMSVATTSSSTFAKTLPASYPTLIAGFAYDIGASPSYGLIFDFVDAAITHISIGVTSDRAVYASRSGTTLGTSANAVIPTPGSFAYIELKATIHDTAGAVEVRVNGVSVLTLTNVDTRNAGNASVTGFRLRGASTTSKIDDLYICDATGSTNNSFLGDVRVDTLYPNADGTFSDFTPSTGTSRFALVDESSVNTTDYNDGAAVGDRDSYEMANLAALASQTVYGVQVSAALQKDDAGAKSAAVFVRSGGTNSDGPAAAIGTSQAFVSQVYETDPAASAAWTETTVNAMQAGVLVTA